MVRVGISKDFIKKDLKKITKGDVRTRQASGRSLYL
jgi:hypothetical protein